MNIVALIIQLVSGAAGGNIAGALLKKFSLGTIWNSVVGILGGGLGGWILSLLGLGGLAGAAGAGGAAPGNLDLGAIIASIAGGGAGGGALMAIIGFIRQTMAQKS